MGAYGRPSAYPTDRRFTWNCQLPVKLVMLSPRVKQGWTQFSYHRTTTVEVLRSFPRQRVPDWIILRDTTHVRLLLYQLDAASFAATSFAFQGIQRLDTVGAPSNIVATLSKVLLIANSLVVDH